MNPGLVRQINDIVRPYRKARMGLLIVISDPVGQRGPTPPVGIRNSMGILACSACRLRGTPRCFVMIMARCGMAIT